MKKIVFIVLFQTFLFSTVLGQNIANYTFSTGTTESLTDMSSGTTTLIGSNQSSTSSAITNIGFDVFFVGAYYNQFSVNTNGVFRFGPIAVVPGGNSYVIPGNDRIVPFAGANTPFVETSSTGRVHYKVIGSAPNRILVIEWLNMEITGGSSADGTFQLRVYESAPGSTNPGRVDMVYGTMVNSTGTDFRIGMGTSGATNHVGITTSALTSTLGSAPSNTYATGTITDLSSASNGSRRFFSYNNAGNAPNGSPTNLTIDCISNNSVNLNWSGTVTNESGYVLYRSDDGGITYNYLTQLSTATTTYTDNGLTSNTTYFYRVYFLSEGVLSSLSGTGQASATTLASNTIFSVSSGNWTAGATWSSGLAPTSADNVIIGCSGNHDITVNTTAQCAQMSIQSGSSISFNSTRSLAVGGSLSNSGTITMADGSLSIIGDLTNNASGVFNGINGSVTMNGSNEQNVNNSGTSASGTNSQTFSTTGSDAINDCCNVANGNNVPTAATLTSCGGCASLSVAVPAGSYNSLTSMNVSLTHTYNDDINMYLLTPDNTVLVIATDVGGSTDDFDNITFIDNASSTPPNNSALTANGSYQPEGVAFSTYSGTFAGTWRLYIADDGLGDQGTLTNFGVTLSETGASVTDIYFETLVINNTSGTGVVLNDSIHVTSALTLTDGYLFSSTSALMIVEDDATASSGSAASYVDGPLRKVGDDAFTFPVGDNGTWARIGINDLQNGPTSSDEFTAQYFVGAHPQSFLDSNVFAGDNANFYNVSIVEYWDLSRNSGTAQPKVVIHWENNATSFITNTSDLRVAHNTGGSTWVNEGATFSGALAAGAITSTNNLSSFSPITFGSLTSTSNPLPIELLSFTASARDNLDVVDLQWTTLSEINNAFFTIERSTDAFHFDPVFDIDGAGNSTQKINYVATDDNPMNGISYYRLKQTDFDGVHSYSAIVAINIHRSESFLKVFPNPVKAGSEVFIQDLQDKIPQYISLYNYEGLLIQQDMNYQLVSDSKLRLQLKSDMTPGLYLIQLVHSKGKEHHRILVR